MPAIIAARTPPVRSTTFHYERNSVTVDIEPRHGVDALFAPRRALLDRTIVDAAAASGATFEHGVQVSDLTRNSHGRVDGVILRAQNGRRYPVRAGLVIGADGLHSTVASRVAAPELRRGRHASAVLYAYWSGAAQLGYQWFFRQGLSVSAIPTDDALCTFVAMPSRRFRELVDSNVHRAYHRLLAIAAPDFYEALSNAREAEHVRGLRGHVRFMRTCQGPGWALVGDAGYFKDPITAHGITDALRDAVLLARAALDGSELAFAQYQASRDELSQALFDVTDDIASFAWDDERQQGLHRSLSHEMGRESRALVDLEPLTCLSRLDNERRAV